MINLFQVPYVFLIILPEGMLSTIMSAPARGSMDTYVVLPEPLPAADTRIWRI